MKKTVILFCALSSLVQLFGQSEVLFSRAEVEEDFRFLFKTLKDTHFDLFVNTSEGAYQKALEQQISMLPEKLSLMEVYRQIQPFTALSGLGHCHTDYPYARLYGAFIQSGGRVFPLNLHVEEDRLWVVRNYSENSSVHIGDEVLSINNRLTSSILETMYRSLSGENDYYKSTLLDMFSFPRILWFLEDPLSHYEIKLRNPNGKVFDVKIDALPALAFEEACSKEKKMFQPGRKVEFYGDIAYLQPGPFLNALGSGNTSETKTFQSDEFFHFVASAFSQILEKKSSHLIIDLRNNSGGTNGFSDELISYIADRPFRFCSTFKVKTSALAKEYWKKVNDPDLVQLKEQILKHKDGEIFDFEIPLKMPKEETKRFKGPVYVLINRYSYSQASLTAAMVQDYKFGKIVGESTADPAIFGSVHEFKLPNSKISVSYPKGFILRVNGDKKLIGVVPDLKVKMDSNSETDATLNDVLALIKGKKP